jgi:hypothetical protein
LKRLEGTFVIQCPAERRLSMRMNGTMKTVGRVFCLAVAMIFVAGQAISAQQKQPKGNVLNLYGAPIGEVDQNGNVLTPYGSKVGRVDSSGNVYNVSNMKIGSVDASGNVYNQSGTQLGSVDSDGNIYNVSGTKVGSVKEGGTIFLTGGAARLLVFRAK